MSENARLVHDGKQRDTHRMKKISENDEKGLQKWMRSVRILFVADADVAQQVERILGKDEVTGSNPVISSI